MDVSPRNKNQYNFFYDILYYVPLNRHLKARNNQRDGEERVDNNTMTTIST